MLNLSIIIPVYNVEKYIERCLNSIYKQGINVCLYEVIVVNDGSLDHSMDIVLEFSAKYKNLFVINQENAGLSAARNAGLTYARGQYIWFVDSDDWLKDDSIKSIISYIEKGYDVMASNLELAYDDTSLNHKERILEKDLILSSYDYLLNYSAGASQRYIIKRTLLKDKNIKFHPGILHEDGEFGPILLSSVKDVLLIAKPLYNYYQRTEGSIMSSWGIRNTKGALVAADTLFMFYEQMKETPIRYAVLYRSFSCYLFAFPKKYIQNNLEISNLYKKKRIVIKKVAIKVVLSPLPIRKRLKGMKYLFFN